MDSSTIAGVASQMALNSQREGISIMMIKKAAEADQKIAGILANAASQPQPDPAFNVSIYA